MRHLVVTLRGSGEIRRFSPYSAAARRLCVAAPPPSVVPEHEPADESDVDHLRRVVASSRRLLVLTGAGISTESGIPDYRSAGVGLYARSQHRPIMHREFVEDAWKRARYWARNYVAWPRFSAATPNANHTTLVAWEHGRRRHLHWLVTQNVDALHAAAGHRGVTELHGCTHSVVCLACGDVTRRHALQTRIAAMNPNWSATTDDIAPDGDVQLSDDLVADFRMPDCERCGGLLKPQVVFFGDNVPKATVDFVYNKVRESDALLVLGSSLYVYSGYRFAVRAKKEGKPVAIVTIGETRADDLADVKISARCSDILARLDA